MNALMNVTNNMGALSTVFQNETAQDDLGSGVSTGFGRIGFKGKVWTIHHHGESLPILRNDGTGDPVASIEVVIVKSSSVVAKTFYEKGYEEGSNVAPDCMSSNGLTPDPHSPNKQCASCAACPRNAWGSQMRADGSAGKGKACSDAKRLAVVPLADIKNDMYGGPMLLRVPAASLQDVATYGKGVAKLGYPYYAVATRIGFDPMDAFPKLTFTPIRALTDEEALMVMEHRNDESIDRILAENAPVLALPEPSAPPLQFEQAPVQAAPVQAAPVQAAQQPKQAARTGAGGGFGGAPAPAPQAAPQVVEDANVAAPADFDATLDEKLAKLMG